MIINPMQLSLSPCHRVPWLYDSFCMTHVEDKGDVWKTLVDETIDLVNKTLLVPIPSAPPIVESIQMQVKRGTDFIQEKSDKRLMLLEEANSVAMPLPYKNSKSELCEENKMNGDFFSEEKKSTEAPPRRRKRDSKPFLNFKTVIAVISKLV